MGLGSAARYGPIYRRIIRPRRCLRLKTAPSWRQPRQQQQYKREHALSFSQVPYQDPTLAWAQSNPGLAKECLNPPPVNDSAPLTKNNLETLEAFLEWRIWTFPNEISGQTRDGTFGDQREKAKALVSHILSAPLTLASQFKHIIEHRANDNIEDGSSAEINWCSVGARSEATIPIVYWKEFLMATRTSQFSTEGCLGNDTLSLSEKSLGISIDFIGPDIPPKLSEQSVSISDSQAGNRSLCLRGYHKGFFHDSQAMGTGNLKSKPWDAFIFFNPGFGHPNLQKSWEPTLKIILDQRQKSSRKTQRALLLTAHSEQDMERDAAILDEVYGLKNVVYHENPFASRVAYEDPFEKNHFVRPNHFVATIII